jgi:DNA-directed RNA polymerase specialized sigma24 family protein
MEDREYQEFLQWLEFKRQRTQETTVVVTAEQPQLHLEHEPPAPPAPKYKKRKNVRNFQQPYTPQHNCVIRDLLAAGWDYEDIGDVLGRSGTAIKKQFHRHIKGKL